MSDHGAARSGTEYDVREYVQEYVYDPIKGSDMCSCSLGERRERVVRCRDCEHMHVVRDWAGLDATECWLHASHETGELGKEPTEPDGFCAWGEVRAGSSRFQQVPAEEGE